MKKKEHAAEVAERKFLPCSDTGTRTRKAYHAAVAARRVRRNSDVLARAESPIGACNVCKQGCVR
jgi:hypothetical protein